MSNIVEVQIMFGRYLTLEETIAIVGPVEPNALWKDVQELAFQHNPKEITIPAPNPKHRVPTMRVPIDIRLQSQTFSCNGQNYAGIGISLDEFDFNKDEMTELQSVKTVEEIIFWLFTKGLLADLRGSYEHIYDVTKMPKCIEVVRAAIGGDPKIIAVVYTN